MNWLDYCDKTMLEKMRTNTLNIIHLETDPVTILSAFELLEKLEGFLSRVSPMDV